MAEASCVETLVQETTCCVCMTYYTDPVTIACGHSFCRLCLAQYWQPGRAAEFTCPQCRQVSEKGVNMRSNTQLANIVAIAKDLSLKVEELRVAGECAAHREKLRLFCRKEQRPICVMCRYSREHRAHEAVPIDEAALEFKEKLKNWLVPLKQEKKEIQEYQSSVENRAVALKNQLANEKQKVVDKFDGLYKMLRNKEQQVLSRLEEMNKKITIARAVNITKLSDDISFLDKLIAEMEEKIQWPSEEFLKEVKNAIQRCENFNFRKPEEKRKNYKVFTTMDPAQAAPHLIVSADGRSITQGGTNPVLQGFPSTLCVLGCYVFNSGRHYWEVAVTGGHGWSVGGNWRIGAARRLTQIKHLPSTPSPAQGIWAMEKSRKNGLSYQALTRPPTSLTLSVNPKRIGIFLDFKEGRLSFYDADNQAHIYTFRHPFRHALVPYFGVGPGTELKLI
ncbi:E3 ubiquitin-protein ligase TRIM39-like [Ambystoma mexicanum]|uniref:E3 ubiquitin-protein ligase TRIM39-like n=1 Tax=Ambystoma mexicanum TaxID=8296 RepID=UPI0037E93CA6